MFEFNSLTIRINKNIYVRCNSSRTAVKRRKYTPTEYKKLSIISIFNSIGFNVLTLLTLGLRTNFKDNIDCYPL